MLKVLVAEVVGFAALAIMALPFFALMYGPGAMHASRVREERQNVVTDVKSDADEAPR